MRLDVPALHFPEPAWTQRFEGFVRRHRWPTSPRLNPGASQADIDLAGSRLGELPVEIRALYHSADGGRFGFESLLPLTKVVTDTPWIRGDVEPSDWAGALPAGVTRSTLIAVAEDGAGNYYAYAPSGPHRVIYLCHDPLGWRHDFTSLRAFLDVILLRALAAAEHEAAEAESGTYIDDAPWVREVREQEARIDPGLLRTRED